MPALYTIFIKIQNFLNWLGLEGNIRFLDVIVTGQGNGPLRYFDVKD